MVRMENVDVGRNVDWVKKEWDWLDVENPEQLRRKLLLVGMTVDEFKRTEMYQANTGHPAVQGI